MLNRASFTSMLLTEIPTFVINLPERVERFNRFCEEQKYLGIDAGIIPGVRENYSRDGIAKAHMNAVRAAEHYPVALIMEDDCIFPAKERTKSFFQNALYNAPPDWDILLGGLYDCEALGPLINGHWRKVEGQLCGLHFYIIRQGCYERFLTWPGGIHIDRWINTVFKTYVSDPFLAIQSPGFSDNVGSQIDYTNKLKKFRVLGLERAHRK